TDYTAGPITLKGGLTTNGATNINVSNNAVTNIGTGTTNALVSIGGGSNAVTIAASAGNLTLSNVTTGTNADTVCMASGNKVTLQASACTISSRRFKEHIRPLEDGAALAAVDALVPSHFVMKGATNPDPNYAQLQVGLIAEDVAKAMPECAIYEDDLKTVKSYRPECVIAYAIKAIQELKQQRKTR